MAAGTACSTSSTSSLPCYVAIYFAGIGISIGRAFVVAMVGEMIAGAAGVGYYLVSMQYGGRAADMYGAPLLLALCGYLINRGFLLLEGRILRWHPQ
ncbi:MAG: hypothetical protein ACOY5F_13290 [Pseudomonadota bacterium]